MAKAKTDQETSPSVELTPADLVKAIAEGMRGGIEASRPQKKTIVTRKKNTPWTPKNGEPKLKLKRPAYQHSVLLDEKLLSNEEIAGFNKLKPGKYLNRIVTVTKRKDKGIDIDYAVKTAAQRLRLLNDFGIRNLEDLLNAVIEESKRPAPVEVDEADE